MPDSNDYIYTQYGLDITALVRGAIDVFGGGDGSGSGGGGGGFATWWPTFIDAFSLLWYSFAILFILYGFLLFIAFLYAARKFNRLAEEENNQIIAAEQAYAAAHGGAAPSRMQDIEQHIRSDSPNDWRLAIIEADIMLEDVLEEAGFVGGTIGEKLKGASPASFTTLQDAWEAHKVRNRIAHEGGDFVLTKKVAQETIQQYRRVFAELGVT